MSDADFARFPGERVLHAAWSTCPYAVAPRSRMPLRLPDRAIVGDALDARLAAGDRRYGQLFYRPECGSCRACESIRLDPNKFAWRKRHRRAFNKGKRTLTQTLGQPQVDAARVALYSKHKRGRKLQSSEEPEITARSYAAFLVDTCTHTVEFAFHDGEDLVGVAIADLGKEAMSLVYCYYDPERVEFGLGTYAILAQINLASQLKMKWVYLGYYIEANDHMRYKAEFKPHERLIDGAWQRFEQLK